MKNLIRWIVIGALTLLLVVLLVLGPSARAVPAIAAFELSQPTLAAPNEQSLPTITPAAIMGTPGAVTGIIPQTGATQTGPIPPTPSGSSIVQIRDRVCVRKLPYTILAMPSSAAFEVIQPAGYVARLDPVTRNPNQLVCRSVLTLSGTQTVVCTGPQGSSLTLRVTNGATVEEYSIPLNMCASTNNAESQQNLLQPTVGPGGPSSTPMPEATNTEPAPDPTDTPAPPDPTETSNPFPTLPIGTP